MQSANLTDDEKSATVKEAEKHLQQAAIKRNLYSNITKLASTNIQPGFEIGPHNAGSFQEYSTDVKMQEFSDTEVSEKKLMKCDAPVEGMPPVVQPKDLYPKRQWYLYQEIRQFVSDEHKDRVAPLPRVPQPGNVTVESDSGSDNAVPSASKRGRGQSRGQSLLEFIWHVFFTKYKNYKRNKKSIPK